MPINCNQPNVYQSGESWTTEANEYYTLRAAHRTTSLNTKHKVQEALLKIAAAPADLHGGDHTVQFVEARLAGGRRPIAGAFLCTAACGHATLHWSVRKQPQRI